MIPSWRTSDRTFKVVWSSLCLAKDVRVLVNLLSKRSGARYSDDAETLIPERFACLAITLGCCLFSVMPAIEKYANPWNAVSLVIEIRLNCDTRCRSVLGVVGQAQTIRKEVVQE